MYDIKTPKTRAMLGTLIFISSVVASCASSEKYSSENNQKTPTDRSANKISPEKSIEPEIRTPSSSDNQSLPGENLPSSYLGKWDVQTENFLDGEQIEIHPGRVFIPHRKWETKYKVILARNRRSQESIGVYDEGIGKMWYTLQLEKPIQYMTGSTVYYSFITLQYSPRYVGFPEFNLEQLYLWVSSPDQIDKMLLDRNWETGNVDILNRPIPSK
jgi:hypothetical protein